MTKKKKICVITTSRAEYGVIRWLIEEINVSSNFELQLIVTGSHLSPEFGLTYKEIEKDNIKINNKIEILLSSSSKVGVAKGMGLCAISIAESFEKLNPRLIIVTGDRYELLPICNTALVMNIPIAHISGGDVTEGAIDNQIRNAITQMSNFHFPGTIESGKRIVEMGAVKETVFVVGEPALDNFNRLDQLSREQLSIDLGLDISKNWILMTYHPETNISLERNMIVLRNIVKCLETQNNCQIIITKSNADYGGYQINNFLDELKDVNNSRFKIFENLGQIRYINILKKVSFMIGNSSSGILEAPSIKCPVINVGNRQKGRLLSNNIINSTGELADLQSAISILDTPEFISGLAKTQTPYGDGNSTNKIIEKLNSIYALI